MPPRHKFASAAPTYRAMCFKFPAVYPQSTPWQFCLQVVSTPKFTTKLSWVLILETKSEWVKAVRKFRDNVTWGNLISKSFEIIRRVQFDWSTLNNQVKFCARWYQKVRTQPFSWRRENRVVFSSAVFVSGKDQVLRNSLNGRWRFSKRRYNVDEEGEREVWNAITCVEVNANRTFSKL